MSDTFTGRKLEWLKAVASSGNLPPSAARVAIILSGYINRETGDAWMSMQRIAKHLDMSRRGVKKAIDAMVDAGFLTCNRGGGGRSTNRYSIAFPTPEIGTHVPPSDSGDRNTRSDLGGERPEQAFHADRNTRSMQLGTGVHPIPLKETIEETSESPPLPPKGDETDGNVLNMFSTDSGDDPSDRFEEFWSIFRPGPHKNRKSDARKRFHRIVKTQPAQIVIDGANRYMAARAGQDPQYDRNPANWLRDEGWTETHSPPPTWRKPARSAADVLADLGHLPTGAIQ